MILSSAMARQVIHIAEEHSDQGQFNIMVVLGSFEQAAHEFS